ncbi:MAG: gamma-glutamyltransferase [FCB group bacterium]|nr:gamma-glutamyltransferase [FCB group bacterium]
MRNFILISLLIPALLAINSCSTIQSDKVYRNGVVVSSDKIASEIGVNALKGGGNAIDAACATALALAVTYPQAGNIGGGGFALIYLADSQKVYYLDFRETAPAAATTDMYIKADGEVDHQRALWGPSSAGTPGTVAGLYELNRRFGSKAWRDNVQPARLLADTGFFISAPLADKLVEYSEELHTYPATAAIFFPGGKAPQAGDRLLQSDLGSTLIAVETDGRDGFYLGETAQRIVDYCADNGGLISMDDLASYFPVWREPVVFGYRNLDIHCAGLPSSGGIVMGQILKMLEQFELERYTPEAPQYMHLFAEASRRAYADRSQYPGDPDFTEDLTEGLLDRAYIASRVESIDPNQATPSADILPGLPRGHGESDQTTHLVTADAAGNIVSLTYTINRTFGSKAVVPGCGFLLNNEMDDFSAAPGVPNSFGLIGGEANKIEGGKRMLSSMSPTIIFQSGQPYMALGSPGGSKIITAVAQTIINYHLFDLTIGEAVSVPRFHHQWLPDKLYLEQGGYDINTIQKLISMGHDVQERSRYSEVMAVGFSPDGAFMIGAADPRQPGGHVSGF